MFSLFSFEIMLCAWMRFPFGESTKAKLILNWKLARWPGYAIRLGWQDFEHCKAGTRWACTCVCFAWERANRSIGLEREVQHWNDRWMDSDEFNFVMVLQMFSCSRSETLSPRCKKGQRNSKDLFGVDFMRLVAYGKGAGPMIIDLCCFPTRSDVSSFPFLSFSCSRA
jgi:hypothetical protein